MKLVFSILSLHFILVGQSQTTPSANFTIESVHLRYGNEVLLHGQQNFSSFSNTVQDDFIFPDDSGFVENSQSTLYGYNSYSGEIGFRKPDSKWRYIAGATFNNRLERYYNLQLENETIIDTIYAPVPASSGESEYFVYYDTLLLDSISMYEITALSHTTTIFVYGEMLRDFKKNKCTFSTGIGLALGVTVKNQIWSSYTQYWGLQMVREQEPDYYQPVWYADIPISSPVQGTINPGEMKPISSDNDRLKGNTIFTFKPYIPIRVEAVIAEKGFFSKVGVMASTSAGAEFQIVKNDGLRVRPFWNYQAGLFFRFSTF